MTEKEYTENSAKMTLNSRLTTLSIWAQRRAEGNHDANTTIAMLKRRFEEIEGAVIKSRHEAYGAYAGAKNLDL